MLTPQTLLHTKVFGDYLPAARPLVYRRPEWNELNKGRERSVRLIVRAMLGVPSAHQGEHEHAMWCFQFPDDGLIVLHLQRGTVCEIATHNEGNKEVVEALDFLIDEVSTRLKQL